MKALLRLTLPIIVLDQLTKWLIQTNLPFLSEYPVVPGFFSLVNVSNTGAAFSLLEGNNFFFVLLAFAALLVVGFYLIRADISGDPSRRLRPVTKTGMALLAGGVAGNLLDRLFRGSVVDFLHFYLGAYAWPSFNVADSCISIAAGLFIWSSFYGPRKVPTGDS